MLHRCALPHRCARALGQNKQSGGYSMLKLGMLLKWYFRKLFDEEGGTFPKNIWKMARNEWTVVRRLSLAIFVLKGHHKSRKTLTPMAVY